MGITQGENFYPYVHLTAKGYSDLGIGQKHEDTGIKDFDKKISTNNGDDVVLAEISAVVSAIMKGDLSDGGETQKLVDALIQELCDIYGAAINQATGIASSINGENISIGHLTKDMDDKIKNQLKYAIGKEASIKNITTHIRNLTNISGLLNNLFNSTDGVDKTKIKNLQKQCNKYLQDYKKLAEKAEPDSKSKANFSNSSSGDLLYQGGINGLSITKMHKQYCQLIRNIISTTPFNYVQGEYFERIIEIALKVILSTSDETANFNVASFLENDKEHFKLSQNTKDKIGQYDTLKKKIEGETFGYSLQLDATFDKQVGIESKADLGFNVVYQGGDKSPIGLSAKSVNLKGTGKGADIHLVSGSPLAYMIQDNTTLLWHSMNLFANHTKGEGDTNQVKDNFGVTPKLQKELLYKAITGDTNRGKSSKGVANYMIINDTSQRGAIKIININNILDKFYNNEDNLNLIHIKLNDEDINSFRNKLSNKNPDKGSVNEQINKRIANNLLEMHKIKVNVSIPKTIITQNS